MTELGLIPFRTVVGMMWPTIDPGVGQWILLGCAVVFGLALIVTLWPDRADAVQSSMGQSTTGSSSHNIQAQGAVHIYHGPAPAPEPVTDD